MFSTSAGSDNGTKRAMQSRHLMMIGEVSMNLYHNLGHVYNEHI